MDDLLGKVPALDRATVDDELLRIAGTLTAKPDAAETATAPELDVSRIVRPELFHAADLSGIAIPAMRIVKGRPSGHWSLYLRWHGDGRRERRDLESSIDLSGGGRLWLHPMPGDPEPTARAGWSASGRAAWIGGNPAPNAAELWARITERLAYFLDFPPGSATGMVATLATWIMFTYCYPAWPAAPYLAVTGPKGSGKTTLLDVLGEIVFRPIKSASLSASALFRELHGSGGVFLYDEAERLRDGTPDVSELRVILNGGYRRGATVSRCEPLGDGKFRTIRFDVYGPKVIAGIAALPETLVDRSIRVGMFRADVASPKPRRRLDENPPAWQVIRDDLHALALEHGATWLELARRIDVCPNTLGGRDFELWQPVLALAHWLESFGASGLLALLREYAERSVESAHDDSVPESDELLLKLLAEHVQDGTHVRTKARDLLKQAVEADSVTFAKWSPKGVSNVFRRYGLETKKGRGSTGRTYSGVTPADLRRVERAYGFDLALPLEHVPTCTERTDMLV